MSTKRNRAAGDAMAAACSPDADLFGTLFAPMPVAPPKPPAAPDLFTPTPLPAAPAIVKPVPKPAPAKSPDGRISLQEGVEYRTLYLWQAAYDALLKNHAICQEFSPAYMGDLLVLLSESIVGDGRGRYLLLAELVAVRDECQGLKRRYIWKFENLREVQPRSGVRQLGIGRITFQPAAAPAALNQKGTP